jgi:hypothetical protein
VIYQPLIWRPDEETKMPIMTLYNRDWQTGVNVEAHQGMSFDPNQNPSLGTRHLTYQTSWIIDSGTDDVQYRRDTDPDNPDGRMTDWTNLSSANGDQKLSV